MSASPTVVDQAMAVAPETPGRLRARLVEEHQRQLERIMQAAASLYGRGSFGSGPGAPGGAVRDSGTTAPPGPRARTCPRPRPHRCGRLALRNTRGNQRPEPSSGEQR